MYLRKGLRPTSAGLTTQHEVDAIFGEPGPHLYSGIVTKVGRGFFGHNINAYAGCSGALIVLLEPSGDAVLESDTGCAIGIHVEYSKAYVANLGLSLWSSDRIKATVPVKSDQIDASISQPKAKKQKT